MRGSAAAVSLGVVVAIAACGPEVLSSGDASSSSGSGTGGEGEGDPDPEAFFPLARSGDRIEVRGFSFEGVPMVFELYDTELETTCELSEEQGVVVCRPSEAGMHDYVCVDCWGGDDVVYARPKTADCGPAYADGWLLTPYALPDDALLTPLGVPDWMDEPSKVAGAQLEAFWPPDNVPGVEEIDSLVTFSPSFELNDAGLGVRVWTGADGTRLVTGPFDARLGEMRVVAGQGRLVPVEFLAQLLGFADPQCEQRALCTFSPEVEGPIALLDEEGRVFGSGDRLPDDQLMFASTDGSCNEVGVVPTCFEAVGPLDEDDYPSIVRTAASSGEVSAEVLSLPTGERIGLEGPRGADQQACVGRRVGDLFRCLPPRPEEEPPIGAFSYFADDQCTELGLHGTGLSSQSPLYRSSVGSCDPGGEVWVWQEQIDDNAFYLATAEGCIPRYLTGPVERYVASDGSAYPAFGALEIF